ncbi:MAG: ATP-grasp domain-containing protein [Polyangiaceae bacterium]|jgi:biotin carboxylase|nr:ATP-grasp domain-containing protein [Polyangiaceae bacterium]MBK8939342.1 ATP-grasp domain-containing protein [Polyangiaceae bacterium]
MATDARPLNILCLACFNTGDRFIERAKERGARVYLLTKETYLRKKRWRRDLLEDVFAEPDNTPIAHTMNTVGFLSRTLRFDRIIPFDDVEVDAAARLREHFRIPGMGDTRARVFRDKLAMRIRAQEEGIRVPDFVGVIHHDDVRAFIERVPAPWMLKPRTEASSTGIQRIESADKLWSTIHELGDRAHHFLLERYLPGDVYHADSVVSEGKVVFVEVHKNGAPPFDVSHSGGVFSTTTVERGSADSKAITEMNEQVLTRFGLLRGVAHLEFIKSRKDGQIYFLEAGARVGGAHVADVVEAATGVNLWAEWADIEIDKGEVPYHLPERRSDYAGLVQCLARVEHPDLSAFSDPEVSYRVPDPYHAGLVVRSPSFARVNQLLDEYTRRLTAEHMAVMPHYELPPLR